MLRTGSRGVAPMAPVNAEQPSQTRTSAVVFQCAFVFLLLALAIRPLLDGADESKLRFAGVAINVAGVVAVLIILVSAVVVVAAKPRTWPSAVLPYIAVLLVSGAASLVALSELHAAVGDKPLQEIVRLAALGAVYVLAANVTARGSSLRTLFVVAALSGVVPAVVGIVQWIRGTPIESGLTISRINGTFSGPNAYGAYLAAAALILIFMPAGWLPRWARLGSLAITLAALVGSFSRTGWVLFFAGILVLSWREHKRVLIAAVAVAVALVFLVPSIRGRVFASDAPSGVSTTGSRFVPSSYDWRIENWHALLWKYRHRPLVGYGLRSTEYVNPLYEIQPGETPTGYSAHNTVVKLLVEGGPFLVLSWAVFFAVAIAKSWRMARERWSFQRLGWVVLGLWIIVAFTGMTGDDPLAATAFMILVFAVAGAVEGAWSARGIVFPASRELMATPTRARKTNGGVERDGAGGTDRRPTPEPAVLEETGTPLELRMLASRTLRFVASRRRLLALGVCVCVGAVAAFAVAEIRGAPSPAQSDYRADAVLRLHDNPLVYHVPRLALHRVADAGGMPYQVQVAVSDRTIAPAAKTLGTTSNALSPQISVRAIGNELHFGTVLRGREHARRTIAAVVATFRGVREADFVSAVNRARSELVHTARTTRNAHDRQDARIQIAYADALLRDRASITRNRGTTLEPQHRRRSTAQATAVGAAAGAAAWLLVLSALAVAAGTNRETWPVVGQMRTPRSGRGEAA